MYTHFVALEGQVLFSPLLIDIEPGVSMSDTGNCHRITPLHCDLHRDRKHDLVTVCRRWCRR